MSEITISKIKRNKEANKEIKRAAAYIRVSTDMQTEFSPDAQLKDIRKYCEEHNFILQEEYIFIEEGVSGKHIDKRVEFKKMLKIAEEKPKKFDVIITHKFDRFARNRRDSINIKYHLRDELGIDIVSVKEPLPEDKKLSMVMESNLEMFGEFYSLNLSDEVKKGQRERTSQGKWTGGTVPFGYKIKYVILNNDNKEEVAIKLVKNEEEAKIVQIIYEKFLGGLSIRNIAKYLNNLGVKTRNNVNFYDKRISYILHNPMYVGYVHWTDGGLGVNWFNDDTVLGKGEHEPIISIDTWEKTQKILTQMHENNIANCSNSVNEENENWLRGILKCGNCGHSLVSHGGSYQCSYYALGGCKISHSIRMKKIQDIILENLKNTYENKNITINISNKHYDNKNEIELIEANINNLNKKFERVKLAYENGIDTIEEYKENKTKLIKEKKELEIKLEDIKINKNYEKIKKTVINSCKEAYNLLIDENVDVYTKREMSARLFEKIVFFKPDNKIEIYYK